MHKIQQEILDLYNSSKEDFKSYRHRDLLQKCTSANHASQISHHLRQLELKGFFAEDNQVITFGKKTNFVDIPVYGEADCGEANAYADLNKVESTIRVSTNLLKYKVNHSNLYALTAKGDSMDKSNINGKCIEDGDYVIVTKSFSHVKDGDIVVSIIDNRANIKKFERGNNQIRLLPMSSNKKHTTIFISNHDKYIISGKVVDVLKV